MSVQVCVALLAFLSLTAASEPECEELTKQLENRTKLHGKWIMYAGTSDCENSLKELKTINSSWLELIPLPDSENMTLRFGDRMDDKCYLGLSNITYDGNITKATFYYNNSYHDHFGRHLETCLDCLFWLDSTVKEGETRVCRNAFFYSRTGKLDDSQQEVFKKQIECLKFPQDFAYGGTADLCPDEEGATEEKKKEE